MIDDILILRLVGEYVVLYLLSLFTLPLFVIFSQLCIYFMIFSKRKQKLITSIRKKEQKLGKYIPFSYILYDNSQIWMGP